MNPVTGRGGGSFLPDELVETQVGGYPLKPLAASVLVGYREVGSLTRQMLAYRTTMYGSVEGRRAVGKE